MAKKLSSSKQKAALGKGIKALLHDIDEELKTIPGKLPSVENDNNRLATVGGNLPIDQIEVNPKQPRIDFDEKALNELAESIKTHGIIQPITVSRLPQGKYRLISGERRLRASKIAGLTSIPAYIRSVDNQELIEMALLENLQREDLNAIEIALSYQMLMDECNLTQEQVADRMNKDRSTVTNYIRLLKLPPDIQMAVRNETISMGHARSLIALENLEEQLYVFREINSKNLSVRQTEVLVRELKAQHTPLKSDSKKQEKNLPAAYKRIEDDMASHFSTKVKLDRKKNGKGSILIEFYSDEDLERIMEAMQL